MKRCFGFGVEMALMALLVGCMSAAGQNKEQVAEEERSVQAPEVPPPALAALQKLAGAAAITEFAEETKGGQKFYEGSWKGPEGNVDALVTAAGDLVEVEEVVAAEKVPAAIRAAIEKQAGTDAAVKFEKKTMILYEAKFKAGGKGMEVLFKPDGGRYHEEEAEEQGEEGEEQ